MSLSLTLRFIFYRSALLSIRIGCVLADAATLCRLLNDTHTPGGLLKCKGLWGLFSHGPPSRYIRNEICDKRNYPASNRATNTLQSERLNHTASFRTHSKSTSDLRSHDRQITPALKNRENRRPDHQRGWVIDRYTVVRRLPLAAVGLSIKHISRLHFGIVLHFVHRRQALDSLIDIAQVWYCFGGVRDSAVTGQ